MTITTDVIELTGEALAQAEREGRAATCGTCGRSWDDTVSTSCTPVPAGRCPFEYDHDTEREPLQYHYVVWAEIRDGKTEWHVDIEGADLLADGPVWDPNAGKFGEGWRRLNEEEEGIDNTLFSDLLTRLGY